MCRKLVAALTMFVSITATSGCLRGFRQHGVELSLVKVKTVRDDTVATAKVVKTIAVELVSAVEQDRPPEVEQPMNELAERLERMHGQCEIAGKILTTMQADLGRSDKPLPQSDEEIKQWIGMYARTSAVWGQITAVLASRMPPMLGGIVSPKKLPGVPWSPIEIAGIISAVVASVGGLAEGTRRGVKRARTKRAGHVAVVDEALGALDEIKGKHPAAVKAACKKEKRPHLRAAFVRREEIV